jgi:phosphate butyryltransferase
VNSIKDVIDKAKEYGIKTVAIAGADSEHIIQAIGSASELNIAKFICFGNRQSMQSHAISASIMKDIPFIETENAEEAARQAVMAVRNHTADVVMKGSLQTGIFMKAILNKETGLRAGGYISSIAAFDHPNGKRIQFITDVALAIEPDIQQKSAIITNALAAAHKLGIVCPRVAVLAALETVNVEMKETIDAAILSKMAERGQLGNCIVDGPLALDNIVSKEAAKEKGIVSDVAGNADIILVPNLVVGNALIKSLTYYAHKPIAGIIAGTIAPVVMNSRADSPDDKVLTIAMACVLSEQKKDENVL